MIIYNKIGLANLKLQNQIKKDYYAGNITLEEVVKVKLAYPTLFYSPNIFVRIGLFILTNIIVSFSAGLLTLIFSDIKEINPEIWLLLSGVACYFILEHVVKHKHHLCSGADDALVWICGGMVFGAVNLLLDPTVRNYSSSIQIMVNTAFLFMISLYLGLRFADRLIATIAFLALLITVGSGWISIGTIGISTLPFLIMVLAAAGYKLSSIYHAHSKALYYQHCLLFLQMVSLLVLYLSGNYYVVEWLGTELLSSSRPYQLPMPYVFWAWTFVIPLSYVAIGIRKKDSILLRSGLILLAASGFTLRQYYYLMSTEVLLVVIGLFILAIAYKLYQHLKTPKNGFTYQELNEGSLTDHLKLESLIVAAMPGSAAAPEGSRFGGGDFGGGGSAADF
jgi:hypothetical protein